MNKRFFLLKFDGPKKSYIIEPIRAGGKFDLDKLEVDVVSKVAAEMWVCTSRQALVDEVEKIKRAKIERYEDMIKSIQDRKLVIN